MDLESKQTWEIEKIGFKIREHTLNVPFMLVCGDQEMEAGEIAVRTRKGKDFGKFKVIILFHKDPSRGFQVVSSIWGIAG